MSRYTLIVFLKRPRAGEVKTRLARALGAPLAARLYRVLAEAEVANTAPTGAEYDRLFAFAPADAGVELNAWFPGNVWLPQEGRDLGERMAGAMETAFDRGAERVAIIGSDVPWVSRELVLKAFAALDEHDVVLGPARDGGYYLIALAQPASGIFESIAWSTDTVASETLRRVAQRGWTHGLLETLPDIDTVDDLRSEWHRVEPLIDDTMLRTALRAHMRLAAEPRRLALLTKPGCGLCEEMLGIVEPVAQQRGLEVMKLDIRQDTELAALYRNEIPVLLLGGRELCRHRVTSEELHARIDAPF